MAAGGPGLGERARGRVAAAAAGRGGSRLTCGARSARIRRTCFLPAAYTAPLALGVPLARHHPRRVVRRASRVVPAAEGARRRLLTRQAARAADVVFTDSEFSQREIVERLGVPTRARTGNLHHGVTRTRRPGRPSREPLVLYAGRFSIGAGCHGDRRVRAATRDAPDARLVIAGADRSYPAHRPRRAGRRSRRGRARRYPELRVANRSSTSLYARARGVHVPVGVRRLRPDAARGAGRRRPAVVLDTPVAREVYGDAACYVGAGGRSAQARPRIEALLDQSRRGAAAMLAAAPADARPLFLGHRGRRDARGDRRDAAGEPCSSIVIVSFNARRDLEACLRVARSNGHRRSHTRSSSSTTQSTDGSAEQRGGCRRRPRDRDGAERRLLRREQRRHPCQRRRPRAAAQQRHDRAAGRARPSRRAAGRDHRRPSPARGWSTPTDGRSCRSAG